MNTPGTKIDLWHNAFIREHVVADDVYYATFHEEYSLTSEDLEHTNRYLVVALHPNVGTIMFHMRHGPAGQGWLPDKPEPAAQGFLASHQEFVGWCSEQIIDHDEAQAHSFSISG